MGLGTGATAKVSQDERRPVILIVDDSAPHARMVADALDTGGFETLVATSSAAAIAMFLETRTDAVILDVLMPHMDGYDVCARIRDFSDVPIIMLSALRNEAEIVQGLNAGADDYVTKPFNVGELIARVGAQLRRVHRQDVNRRRVHIEADDLSIDLDGRRVSRGGSDIRLSPTEFRLLSYLAANRGRVVPHNELITQLWGEDGARLGPYLKIYVRRLRQKVEREPGTPSLIVSRHGSGYVFSEKVPVKS